MIEIDAPDGTIVEFPDGTPDKEIIGVMQREYPPLKTAPQTQPSTSSFYERTKANLQQREKNISDINKKPISWAEKKIQGMGQAGMALSDTLGDAVVSGASYLTPDAIENPILDAASSAYETVSNSGVGVMTGQGVEVLGAGYENIRKNYPRVVDDIEGVFGMAMGVAPFTSTGRGVAKKAVDKAKDLSMSPVTTTFDVKDIVKGLGSKTTDQIETDLANLRTYTNDFINKTKVANIKITSQKTTKIFDNVVDKALNNPEFVGVSNTRADLYREVRAEIDRFQNSIDANQEIGIPDIDASRKQFNRIWSASRDADGKPSEEGVLAMQLSRLLRSETEGLSDGDILGDKKHVKNSLDAAKAYSQLAKAEEQLSMVVDSKGDAKKLKKMITSFYTKKENLVGYSKSERAALKRAKNVSTFEGALSVLSSLNPIDSNYSGALFRAGLLTGGATMLGMPLTMAAPLGMGLMSAGAVAAPLRSGLVKQRAKNVIETLSKSNPLVGKK